MRPLACLLLAALLAAASLPAAHAVTCDSFRSAAECQGKVTDGGRCGWTGDACTVIAPFEEEGMAAVTSIEEPSLSITSAGPEQPIQEAPPAQPAQPACDELPTPDNFTCAQQAAWGKCTEAWLVQGGYCRATCKLCTAPKAKTAGAAAAPAAEGPTSSEFCTLPADKGPCRAALPSWFYNAATGACEPFIYGGCQGNANRFPDAATCEAAAAQFCKGRSDRLALQLMSATGPADASLAAGAAGADQPTEAAPGGTETAVPAKSSASTGRSLFAWAALAALFHLL
ncbi:tissue factor pathway inhibitor 2 [Chlorella sorokiniana]|uniref:Tissue factor pathway inhibitor 2 n=1 Tax=Chlorella sorokiniana TaxID=3076 RepID=A0A2P6TER7_CHLSO|nr:tissue factor pathway inhibitor 2 [Chlorella sorokiniana]|eukprot:PRW21136.1 tissue factor pathway inhibitor 2 [Chlorella sorokiniana]